MIVRWLLVFGLLLGGIEMIDGLEHRKLVEAFSDDLLYVSNYPESVSKPGLIVSTTLKEKGVRLMYHHRNSSDAPLFVSVLLTNPHSRPAVVGVTQGLGGSSEDVVFAGHKAMREFFEGVVAPTGNIVIPPHSSLSLIVHKIKPLQTASGFLRFYRRSPREIGLKVKMVDMVYPHLSGFLDVGDVWDHYRIGVYESGYERVEDTVEIGNTSFSYRIGGKPYIRDRSTSDILKGNYGKVYDIRVTLVNPGGDKKGVRGYVTPLKKGGVDRGVFLVDGVVKEIGVLRYGENVVQSEELFDLELGPHERREVTIMSIPQAGCYYPLELSFKPIP